MHLLDVTLLREPSVDVEHGYLRINIRYCLSDRQKVLDGSLVEIHVKDYKMIGIDLEEPLSCEKLANALHELGNAIAKETENNGDKE